MLKTAVLIDDDLDDLEILKDTIESVDSNLRCICFINPVEALRVLSNRLIAIPHFIFTDINMPRMTGDEVVQELRKNQEFNKTVISVSSTSMPDEVSKNLKKMGANYTFKKQHVMSILEEKVKDILMHQHSTLQRKLSIDGWIPC
jgi:response regulator RpfG family c-di-GMP phosphodiesterase